MAGFISSAWAGMGKRLTEPEMRALFDAGARDMGKGDIDTSLPDAPEAFSKAIQRYRPKLKPDKK